MSKGPKPYNPRNTKSFTTIKLQKSNIAVKINKKIKKYMDQQYKNAEEMLFQIQSMNVFSKVSIAKLV